MRRRQTGPSADQAGTAPEPEPMTDFGLQVERLGRQRITVRQDGGTQQITATEAVLRKRLATALGGSPHAQRQYAEDVRRIEEKRQALIADETDALSALQARHRRLYASHRATHGCDPEIYPHPDDLEFAPGKRTRITGPIDRAGHLRMLRTIDEIEALLLQDALDRARAGRRRCPRIDPGDPVWPAGLLNETLPPRLRRSAVDLVGRRLELAGWPRRVLLKETRAAWRRAGQEVARGAAAPDREVVVGLANMVRDLIRDAAASDPDEVDVEAAVEQAWRQWMR